MTGYEYLKIVGARKPKAENMRFYILIQPRDGGYAFWDDIVAAALFNMGAEGGFLREGKYRYMDNLLFFPSLDNIKAFWEHIEKSDCMCDALKSAGVYPVIRDTQGPWKCTVHLYKNGFEYWASKKCEREMAKLRKENK